MEDPQSTEPKTFSEEEVKEIVSKILHEAGAPKPQTQRGCLRDPIWQFVAVPVAVILTIAMIIVTYNIFFLQRPVKSVKITVLANTSIAEISDAVSEDIQLLYKGNPVPGLSLVQIKLENNGNVEIRSTDYESPITLVFPPETTVVDAAVIESEPKDLGIDMTWQNNKVILSETLLNPQDRVILRFLVVAPTQGFLTLQTDERIAGLNNISVVDALSVSDPFLAGQAFRRRVDDTMVRVAGPISDTARCLSTLIFIVFMPISLYVLLSRLRRASTTKNEQREPPKNEGL